MTIDRDAVREALKSFDFSKLFIEELGWDRPPTAGVTVPLDGATFVLNPIAHKRGMVVFLCETESIPPHALRQKIDRQATTAAHEHLIVYVDSHHANQVWQWVRREPGRPRATRQHAFHRDQAGDSLIQKLEVLAFDLEDEEDLTVTTVAGRARQAFDVDRVTKRFYDRFKTEHGVFLEFIRGIQSQGDREWYASLMLNRLMFVYFIQKKGFLDDDPDYLRNRLRRMKEGWGKDQFHAFYRHFLLRLFHEGLSQEPEARPSDLDALVGRVPYLNGGLFDVHLLEQRYKDIEVKDSAFEAIFDFFDAYHWHLDERPLRADNEINPDVLGYIFEKYINQRQMGAYYTKEDITEYISKGSLIPHLFFDARRQCPIAFRPDGLVWTLLCEDPDRYIFEQVRFGAGNPLPTNIAVGLSDLSKRSHWNELASASHGLPTETWRECVRRRAHYEALRRELERGSVTSIEELVTLNLDLRQFAQDVIESAEGPELIRAFFNAIQAVSILDPACGSGAFLFAALSILEPLYEATLERMRGFVDDAERANTEDLVEKFQDFRRVLEAVNSHPNVRSFIFKTLIIHNLYGVDIMEEAVEICKLRLFLKLVAQVDRVEDVEPLPDIDFNIRPGNSLVGFATYEEVAAAIGATLDFTNAMDRIDAAAKTLHVDFEEFRQSQIDARMTAAELGAAKTKLRVGVDDLVLELDRYLGSDYGLDAADDRQFETWKAESQPFHWFAEFYGILAGGGFDVIIGNPPYLELREVEYQPRGFTVGETGAIHAMFVERGLRLLSPTGAVSMIVPMSLVSTQRMGVVQALLEQGRSAWYANFSWRPGKLFDTVNRALTIFVTAPAPNEGRTYATGYQKWNSESRADLIPLVRYVETPRERTMTWVPKLGDPIERSILAKFLGAKSLLGAVMGRSSHRIYYRTTGGLYWKVFTDFAPAFRVNGESGHSTRETSLSLTKDEYVHPALAVLSSDLFWWWYTITSNCRDLNPYDIQNFPMPVAVLQDKELAAIAAEYLEDLKKNSSMLTRNQQRTGLTETQAFKIQKSKPIIDNIDRQLAPHYQLTDDELEYVINYDIKYRIGADAVAES